MTMSAPRKIQPKRVLVVDDEASVVLLLKHFLEDAGYLTGSAADGVEGLRKFQEGTWNLVVIDRLMPKMSGEELAEAIKKLCPHVQVILITGVGNRGLPSGLFDAVLLKHFTPTAFLACVARLIERQARYVCSWTPEPIAE
jgi:CheY-like chemotaxis protein